MGGSHIPLRCLFPWTHYTEGAKCCCLSRKPRFSIIPLRRHFITQLGQINSPFLDLILFWAENLPTEQKHKWRKRVKKAALATHSSLVSWQRLHPIHRSRVTHTTTKDNAEGKGGWMGGWVVSMLILHSSRTALKDLPRSAALHHLSGGLQWHRWQGHSTICPRQAQHLAEGGHRRGRMLFVLSGTNTNLDGTIRHQTPFQHYASENQ